jgi:subtilisin family serine protease
MKPFPAASVLAFVLLAASAPCALAAIGDVVALVPAASVSPEGRTGGATTAAAARRLVAEPALAATLSRLGYARVTALGAPTGGAFQPMRLVRLSPTGGGLDEGAARLAAKALVTDGGAIAAAADRALKLFVTLPNDSDLAAQWYIDGPGDIHLPEAWDLEKSSPSVVIGIMDTGVDLGHPDLASKIWTNPGEIPANGIDDDGNGYIDDVHGWDFGNDDADPNPEPMFDELGIDVAFHGTAVAGVAAAATNNLWGIAGAGWNAKILPLKIADVNGQTLVSYALEGILYCAGKHPGVLNMSIGTADAAPEEVTLFQAAIDQAVAGNVVCVASAGNENSSVPVVPASLNGVLSVAATTQGNARSDFSNWGPWVDVAAPGELMWVPICRNYTLDEVSEIIYEFYFGYDGGRPYMYADGTSFSCPLTAGVCALVRAHFPTAQAVGVMNHVIQTGEAIVYDHPIGRKVNAYQAVATPLGVLDPPLAGGALALLGARPTPFTGATTLAFRLGATAHVRLGIVDAAGRRVRGLVDGTLPGGLRTAQWDGKDDAGRTAPAGIYFAVLEGEGARAVSRLVRLN